MQQRDRLLQPQMYLDRYYQKKKSQEVYLKGQSRAELLDALRRPAFEGFFNLAAIIFVVQLVYMTLRNIRENGVLMTWDDFTCAQMVEDVVLCCVTIPAIFLFSLWTYKCTKLWSEGKISWRSAIGQYMLGQFLHLVIPVYYLYVKTISPTISVLNVMVLLIMLLKNHSYFMTNVRLAREKWALLFQESFDSGAKSGQQQGSQSERKTYEPEYVVEGFNVDLGTFAQEFGDEYLMRGKDEKRSSSNRKKPTENQKRPVSSLLARVRSWSSSMHDSKDWRSSLRSGNPKYEIELADLHFLGIPGVSPSSMQSMKSTVSETDSQLDSNHGHDFLSPNSESSSIHSDQIDGSSAELSDTLHSNFNSSMGQSHGPSTYEVPRGDPSPQHGAYSHSKLPSKMANSSEREFGHTGDSVETLSPVAIIRKSGQGPVVTRPHRSLSDPALARHSLTSWKGSGPAVSQAQWREALARKRISEAVETINQCSTETKRKASGDSLGGLKKRVLEALSMLHARMERRIGEPSAARVSAAEGKHVANEQKSSLSRKKGVSGSNRGSRHRFSKSPSPRQNRYNDGSGDQPGSPPRARHRRIDTNAYTLPASFQGGAQTFPMRRRSSVSESRMLEKLINLERAANADTLALRPFASTIRSWPDNITLKNYIYFLLLPTLVYEPEFRRTSKIDYKDMGIKIMEAFLSVFAQYFIFRQFLLPTLMNPTPAIASFSGPFQPIGRLLAFLFDLLKLTVPSMLLWLLGFYALFHCVLNILANALRYGDRIFYLDWWNATKINTFWNKWNLPVHEWALRHIYLETQYYGGVNRVMAVMATFFISAWAHELIFSVAFKTFRPWFFIAMLLQGPIVALGEFFKPESRRGNLLMWLSLFIGQPLLELLYFREFFETHYGERAFFCLST